MRNALVITIVLAMLAPTAVAFHRSVGGDVAVAITPAEEYTLDPPRDVTGTSGSDGGFGDHIVRQADGTFAYTNTLDPSLSAQFDRVAPPDQSYPDDTGKIGYFDVVYLNYVGTLQLSYIDPVDFVTGDAGGSHSATYSPNLYYSLPPLTTVNSVAPGTVGSGDSGVWYPTAGFFYAYLFGDGTATNAAGEDLTVDHPDFEGLIDADACAPRGTERCQLLSTLDLNAMVAGDSTGRQAAICAWNPLIHIRANADVSSCRDFDFGYLTDNPDEWGAQSQPSSPTWVYAGIPGWYGNKALIPAREVHSSMGAAGGGNEWNYGTTPLIMHFTVGAAFDDEILANGGISNPREGIGPTVCIEPGFDVGNYLAHDLDIYHPPESNSASVGRNAEEIVDETTDLLGPVGDQIDAAIDLAFDAVNDATDPAFEDRVDPPYYDEDNSGAIEVVKGSRFDCRLPDDPDEYDKRYGKVAEVDGETIVNWLDADVWIDAVGLAPPTDAVEGLDPADDHENPGTVSILYFSGGVGENSDSGGDVNLLDGFYDTDAVSGDACAAKDTFTGVCIGDWMAENGYADPTSLVFVFRGNGPINFVDWNNFDNYVWAAHPDGGVHCAIGASKNVFDLETGQTLQQPQVFDAILSRVAPGESVTGLTSTATNEKLRQTLCDGADTLEYFPGAGFSDHPNGGSLGNPFGWQATTTAGGVHKATLDVFYVLSVDKGDGLFQDKLGLDQLTMGDPTVVADDGSVVTMVWQERTELESRA